MVHTKQSVTEKSGGTKAYCLWLSCTHTHFTSGGVGQQKESVPAVPAVPAENHHHSRIVQDRYRSMYG